MISYEEKGSKFNFRVSAIILTPAKDQLLIHQIKDWGFWLLPGGRAEMLESAEQSILRELKEELDLSVADAKLAVISENFFHFKNASYHELGFTYVVVLPSNSPLLKNEEMFSGKEGGKYLFKWYPLTKLNELDFRPKFLIEEIENIGKSSGIKQIFVDERVSK